MLQISNMLVGDPLAEISVEISASRPFLNSNFICGADDFSENDKINVFQQQKQLLLFLSNITPKVLMC